MWEIYRAISLHWEERGSFPIHRERGRGDVNCLLNTLSGTEPLSLTTSLPRSVPRVSFELAVLLSPSSYRIFHATDCLLFFCLFINSLILPVFHICLNLVRYYTSIGTASHGVGSTLRVRAPIQFPSLHLSQF